MKPWELFKELWDAEYINSGDDVDWNVKVYDDEKVVRLIFQGSVELRDWINDFIFPIKPYKNQENTLWVAAGWANAYKSCNDEIMNAFISKVAEYKDKNYKIEICGYSYGGVMAMLAAEEYNFKTKDKADLITFGCPKPFFGKKTIKYVSSTVNSAVQYAHVNDFVPRCIPLIGYDEINRVFIGDKFNVFKFFNIAKYHTIYGDQSLYE